MDEKRLYFVAEEENRSNFPLLVVDKKGMIGSALAKKMQEEFLVVLASGHNLEAHKNTIHIPYRRKIPLIPDNIYSHIFIVYNGEKEVLDMLPAFVKKAREASAKIIFITHLLHSSKDLFSYLGQHLFHDVVMVVFGETFDNNIIEANEVNFFIHQARVYGRIAVPNTGLGKLYPVLLDDVIDSLIAIGFAIEKRRGLFFVFPHHPITEVSVARIFQKIDPDLRIDFKKHKNQASDFYIPQEGIYFFTNYDLEERLRKIDLSRRVTRTAVAQGNIRLVLPRRRRQFSFTWLLLVFVLFLLVPVSSIILALTGVGALSLSLKDLEKGQFSSAKSYAVLAQSAFSSSEVLARGIVVPAWLGGSKKEMYEQKIRLGKEGAALGGETAAAFSLLRDIYEQKSQNPKGDFSQALTTLKNVVIAVQKMRAENRLPDDVAARLEGMKGFTTLFENTADTWPALLGFEGKKTYLVLFQNNMELRPGGGFIGSYGILGIENGRVDKFQVNDVYDADGMLKVHVEPPYALRRYLGATHWYLRDSNYDPDFTRSAIEAARFLKTETGTDVDGVIAIDTDFLKNLISVLGPITVADYKETVTADNFYMLTQTHAEKDFFPGSTQKKDFLRTLTNTLMINLSDNKNVPHQKLLGKIVESIEQKHVLFAFSDTGIQNAFTINGLSSSLWDGRGEEENAFADFFGVSEANVGTNKANYYLKRSIRQDVVIGEGGTYEATATIDYENTSKKDSAFGGDYRTYIRFIIPLGATLERVMMDDKESKFVPAIMDPVVYTKKSFVAPAALEVEKTQEKGKAVIGFFFGVPAGQTKTVGITYTVPRPVDTAKPAFSYDLRLFKQPGTGSDPYSLYVSYPSAFKLLKAEETGRDLGGKFVYSQNLSEDKNIRLEFSKK